MTDLFQPRGRPQSVEIRPTSRLLNNSLLVDASVPAQPRGDGLALQTSHISGVCCVGGSAWAQSCARQAIQRYTIPMSRVRDLVQRVHKSDEGKPYHPEISERFPHLHRTGASAMSALEREIAEEVAYSLGRAGKRIERCLRELDRLAQQLDELEVDPQPSPETQAAIEHLHARFDEARLNAQGALRDLRIQREALGMRRHDDLAKLYVVPARRTRPEQRR
jgi:hypothetical protein